MRRGPHGHDGRVGDGGRGSLSPEGTRIMPPDQAAITWSEGLAAVLTLGMITVLLGVEAREVKPSDEHRAKA